MRFAAVRQIYILFNIYLLLVTNITNLLKDYFITNTYYQKFILKNIFLFLYIKAAVTTIKINPTPNAIGKFIY